MIQNEVLLSEAETHQCMWASSANWKVGPGKNIEIDLLQENRNKDIKKAIPYLLVYKSTPHFQGQKSYFSSYRVKEMKFTPIEISQKVNNFL